MNFKTKRNVESNFSFNICHSLAVKEFIRLFASKNVNLIIKSKNSNLEFFSSFPKQNYSKMIKCCQANF